ncbi:MAG: magnetosome protein MamC [Bdellovibrionales bacterium]|jgi:hypothetical protein|nr:magnetosome protein MamC [Bdellovibrionales bacterium]MBT3525393.1 magnetosome protein MamC [Bdellovibrionales bacterium]MBT7766003.1 magnetosome protein MamC [Bdellovibrionales bacterium]
MFNLAQFLAQSVTGIGVLGGVVGGSAKLADVAAAKKKKEIPLPEASYAVSKEAAGAGVATAFSAFSAGVVGGGLAVSLITAFGAATVGKYAWDWGVDAIERQVGK